MSADQSFAPVCDGRARVLILGSLPGKRSIAEQGYYAHPRNAFWPIMTELLDLGQNLSYPQRLERLKDSGIALWDVVAQAQRPGSLDSAIVKRGAQFNDIPALIEQCPRLETIIFNGAAAADLFRRAQKQWSISLEAIERCQLPSTSPALASLSTREKCDRWGEALSQVLEINRKV